MMRIEAHLRAQRRQLRVVETAALVQALDVIKRSDLDTVIRNGSWLMAHSFGLRITRTA